MLWVWVVIVGSLALASYLWMRIDELEKAERTAGPAGPSAEGRVSNAGSRRLGSSTHRASFPHE
jgi:hypothetical protein